MEHELKTHPGPFDDVVMGHKTFEHRRDDRTPRFEVGDTLVLLEWNPSTGKHTGMKKTVLVAHVIRWPAWGVAEGYCVMSIANIDPRSETFRLQTDLTNERYITAKALARAEIAETSLHKVATQCGELAAQRDAQQDRAIAEHERADRLDKQVREMRSELVAAEQIAFDQCRRAEKAEAELKESQAEWQKWKATASTTEANETILSLESERDGLRKEVNSWRAYGIAGETI